jgi:hypothetical protein
VQSRGYPGSMFVMTPFVFKNPYQPMARASPTASYFVSSFLNIFQPFSAVSTSLQPSWPRHACRFAVDCTASFTVHTNTSLGRWCRVLHVWSLLGAC